jgi:hypothetical protein
MTQFTKGESVVLLPLSEAGLQAAQNGERWMETASAAGGGERFLICSEPVLLEGQVREIARVARSWADLDESLGVLADSLLADSGVAMMITFGLGRMLAGVTLYPIHRIADGA